MYALPSSVGAAAAFEFTKRLADSLMGSGNHLAVWMPTAPSYNEVAPRVRQVFRGWGARSARVEHSWRLLSVVDER